MKIIVTTPFRDKAFDNKIIREEGTIIDTDDKSFKCDEELAKERISGGFCVEVQEASLEKTEDEKVEELVDRTIKTIKEVKKRETKGKKETKK